MRVSIQVLLLASVLPATYLRAQSAPSPAPCTVNLFSNLEFADFNPKYFTYTPSCPGPWSRVVLSAEFNITAGIQFDRTAQISLGYVNVYYGTTREDTPTFAPTWHVERDLTDYGSLFTSTQAGEADLGNLVDDQYTGIIYGSATLLFYPVQGSAPVAADAVYPMPNAPGGAVPLYTTTDQLTGTFQLPANVESAYLDVITQSQSGDEFWYTCVPNDVSSELESCANTAFREAEITIDGTPAGVAPVYPWIYTGGIDPALWQPIPGVQTLNFLPYRVDLSPFAGVLSNGQPHTVALSVFNANSYFLATATLLIYEDHGGSQVTGEVTTNTLTPPNPTVAENINVDANGNISGTVAVTSNRSFTISGTVQTSHGTLYPSVQQTINFSNTQSFLINAQRYVQSISQVSTVDDATGTSLFRYPLLLDIDETLEADGNIDLTTTVSQQYFGTLQGVQRQFQFRGTDTAIFDPNFNYLGNQGQVSSLFGQIQNASSCSFNLISAQNDVVNSQQSGTCQ